VISPLKLLARIANALTAPITFGRGEAVDLHESRVVRDYQSCVESPPDFTIPEPGVEVADECRRSRLGPVAAARRCRRHEAHAALYSAEETCGGCVDQLTEQQLETIATVRAELSTANSYATQASERIRSSRSGPRGSSQRRWGRISSSCRSSFIPAIEEARDVYPAQ